ncbi:hypothetical protein [Actinoplanes sp. NPDC051411]|jgi:hypothetical protein|uniref:hypothetical protein n=1 Tax=Actinoplanes sp. NPDC051411 TaxID=3155522 RepID=UPI003424FB1D
MRRPLLVAGVLAMLYAAVGSVLELGGKLGGVLIFLVAVLVVHDAIWSPLVLLAGKLLRGPVVRTAAIVVAALTVTALPLAFGLGRTADNPSALPLDYGRNLALLLLGVAGATGVILAVRRKKRARADAHPRKVRHYER